MLEIIALKMYETLSKKKELIKIMLSEITVYPEKVREIYRKLIKDTDNTIVEIFKKNGIETKKIEELINMFLGGVFSYFLKNEIFCLYSPTEEEIKEYLKTYANVFAKGIKSEEK
jgi:regulator of sirC expression with transglutaminase-like and TPR domain